MAVCKLCIYFRKSLPIILSQPQDIFWIHASVLLFKKTCFSWSWLFFIIMYFCLTDRTYEAAEVIVKHVDFFTFSQCPSGTSSGRSSHSLSRYLLQWWPWLWQDQAEYFFKFYLFNGIWSYTLSVCSVSCLHLLFLSVLNSSYTATCRSITSSSWGWSCILSMGMLGKLLSIPLIHWAVFWLHRGACAQGNATFLWD